MTHTPNDPSRLLRVSDVAAMLDMSVDVVYDMVRPGGELPAVRRGRWIRVPAWAVEAWIERKLQEHQQIEYTGHTR